MLRNAHDLKGLTVVTKDGEVGKIEGVYVDEKIWIVRYLLVEVGGWLSTRKVLVETTNAGQPEWAQHRLFVYLTPAQIEERPQIDPKTPLIDQENVFLSNKAGPPIDKLGGGLLEENVVGMHPDSIVETIKAKEVIAQGSTKPPYSDPAQLRFADHLIGSQVQAQDGEVGQVEDIIFDDQTWVVHFLLVETGQWLPGKKVIFAPSWLERIDWKNAQVYLKEVTQAAVKNSPAYDPSVSLNRTYEERLFEYYRRQEY